MTDQKVRRKRAKKRITPAKAVAAFLCAALAVTFFYSRGTEAEQVTVPTAQTTSSGWGDASSQTNATESTAEVKLPQKTLTLDSCKKMAYATSDKLDELNDKLAQKEAAYEDKVKAAAVKIEYVKHFHWKFLLSFDFPRDLTFEELRQVAYEPKEALQEVKQVKEDMTALQMDLDQSVTDLYISIYKGRQSISIDEERLELANDKVATVTAMVATGEKNDEDLKEAQQKVKNLESRIVATTSANDASAKKLGKLLGLIDEYGNLSDPTLAGYRLEVPYSTDVIGKVDRKDLGWLQRYTLDHDSTIFEARGNKSLAYVDLTTVYEAINRNMKPWDMAIITPFYRDVIAGRVINKRDLKNANKQFLKAVDIYWEGSYKIGFWPLLFKLEREWFKGKADGTWYMMDSPDALYETILEYYTMTTELKNAESDKEMEVEDAFNTFAGLKTSLLTVREQKADQYEKFKEAKIEYKLGELGAEEYNAILTAYEDLEIQELDSLATFSENVNSLNRTTCGALNKLLAGDDLDNEFTAQLVVANNINGASYFIAPKYEELIFDLGVVVPEDFKYNITHFELWCDNVQIGTKTEVGQTIRHLMEATANVEKVIIRLYDGDNFIADCEINPGLLQGPLNIPEYTDNTKLENQVGTFEITTPEEGITVNFKLIPDTIENMGYFVIYDTNGKAVGGEEKRKVDDGIQYLNELQQSLGTVTLKCYDKDGNYLYDATLDVAHSAVIKVVNNSENNTEGNAAN